MSAASPGVALTPLSRKLSALRDDRRWTYAELSAHSTLSAPYLCDLEQGRATPSVNTLSQLAQAYGLSVQELIAGTAGFDTPDAAAPAGTRRLHPRALPRSLRELTEHPDLSAGLDDDMLRLMMRIDHEGQRPTSMGAWYTLYRTLRRLLE